MNRGSPPLRPTTIPAWVSFRFLVVLKKRISPAFARSLEMRFPSFRKRSTVLETRILCFL